MDLLTELGTRHGTDKVMHGFSGFYHKHLASRRHSVAKILEIGVARGASLLTWRDYFPEAEIHAMDLHRPDFLPPSRVRIHIGDQADRQALSRLIEKAGSDFDIIIEDGGHTMEQQQVSLAFLFPHVKSGGSYLLEDIHTSFAPYIQLFETNGQVASTYSTGIDDCRCTTYQLVEALTRGESIDSDFMSTPEMNYLAAEVESAELFDRDGDHAHITSVIRKREGAEK